MSNLIIENATEGQNKRITGVRRVSVGHAFSYGKNEKAQRFSAYYNTLQAQ